MRNYILSIIVLFLFVGCAHEHQINIGKITLQERTSNALQHQDYYMSLTQEYYDNKLYPVNEYCDDQRTYLADDKFSTETYLKITNERTKQSRVGKYPIWFLLNDDSSNISCVKKSANFINAEPFVVSDVDNLSVKLLQKNEAATTVPIQELGVLIDVVSLFVPRTANFLMRANNIIKDPVTQNYLNLMDESFTNGDLDGTKNRDFTTKVESIKVKLYVPEEKSSKELGYILLKPKYRTTLTTVDVHNGVPNFRFIYNSSDPIVEDLMQYVLPHKKVPVQMVVDNFRQVSSKHIIEALSSLNTHLVNRFTRYDRALILSLALRQSDLYKKLVQSLQTKDMVTLHQYVKVIRDKKNPLHDLNKELKMTKCDYFGVMSQAQELIKQEKEIVAEHNAEAKRLKEEQLAYQVEMQGIENFLNPVSNWKYLPQMFSKNVEIFKTTGESLTLQELTNLYSREENVNAYGCYVALQRDIDIQFRKSLQKQRVSIQKYLIHPNYSRDTKYDYMAISVNKNSQIDTIFYKLISEGSSLKIDKMLIDNSNRFISKSRVREIIKGNRAQECSNNIRRLF